MNINRKYTAYIEYIYSIKMEEEEEEIDDGYYENNNLYNYKN